MARVVVTVGSAASFVVAAVAGVLGNQLTEDAVWAWVAFSVALVVGAGVTALMAYQGTPIPEQRARDEPAGAAEQHAGDGPAAGDLVAGTHKPELRNVEGPAAQRDVILKGTYVAGHDITVTGPEGARRSKRP